MNDDGVTVRRNSELADYGTRNNNSCELHHRHIEAASQDIGWLLLAFPTLNREMDVEVAQMHSM